MPLTSKTLIAPCAGLSTRYGSGKPKFLYTLPNGKPLFIESLLPLVKYHDQLIFVILRQHSDEYDADLIINQAIKEYKLDINYLIHIVDSPLNGPAASVAAVLNEYQVEGSITIKDCDSLLDIDTNYPSFKNFVGFANAQSQHIERISSKSSLEVDSQGKILRIVEKRLFSSLISTGVYGFENAHLFKDHFKNLLITLQDREMFVSHVIESMIKEHHSFWSYEVNNFVDLGTKEDFIKFAKRFSSFFCDIDGVVFKNRGYFGSNTWLDNPVPLTKNIDALLNKQSNGVKIIFTTSRPSCIRDKTIRDLQDVGFSDFELIMDLPHSSRFIINDFAPTNPYPSCESISLPRDSDLSTYLNSF